MSIDVDKKSKRGRPQVDSELVSARIAQPLLGQLDAFIASHAEPRPSRPDAVRTLLQEALAAKGPITSTETRTVLTNEIQALEQDLACIGTGHEQSPEAALHTMDRAVAENELVALKTRRKQLKKDGSN